MLTVWYCAILHLIVPGLLCSLKHLGVTRSIARAQPSAHPVQYTVSNVRVPHADDSLVLGQLSLRAMHVLWVIADGVMMSFKSKYVQPRSSVAGLV